MLGYRSRRNEEIVKVPFNVMICVKDKDLSCSTVDSTKTKQEWTLWMGTFLASVGNESGLFKNFFFYIWYLWYEETDGQPARRTDR